MHWLSYFSEEASMIIVVSCVPLNLTVMLNNIIYNQTATTVLLEMHSIGLKICPLAFSPFLLWMVTLRASYLNVSVPRK